MTPVEVPITEQFDIKEFIHENSSFETENRTRMRSTLGSSVVLISSLVLGVVLDSSLVLSVVLFHRYKLIGMIRHVGSLQTGHYVSYCKLKGDDKQMQVKP